MLFLRKIIGSYLLFLLNKKIIQKSQKKLLTLCLFRDNIEVDYE